MRGRSRRIPTPLVVTMPHQGVLFETPVLTFSAVRDGFNYKFWVYILVSRTGTLYIGITGYFDRRISQHKMDSIEGSTSKYKIHRLVYYETYDHVLNAIRREKQLKAGDEKRKLRWLKRSIRAGRAWLKTGEEKCGFGDRPSEERLDAAWQKDALSGSFDCASHSPRAALRMT
jgi:putative endonuclease